MLINFAIAITYKPSEQTMNIDKVYQDSQERIIKYEEKYGDFFNRFYSHFLQSSPEIYDKFAKTNMRNQVTILKNFLVHLQSYYQTGNINSRLAEVAVTHNRSGQNIQAHLYDLWLSSLLKTLAECDPKYSNKVKDAWVHVLTPGIDYMKGEY